MSKNANFEPRLFYGLLILLVWLPLPFGSNRVWAEALFEVWVAVLGLFWVIGWLRFAVTPGAAVSGARTMFWLFAIWLLYLLFMQVPLPLSLRQLLSPESAAMYQAAGVDGQAPLSLHSYVTFQYWMKSASYALLFTLILLLVNTKQRLILLAYTLVCSGLFQAFYGSMMTLSGEEYGFFISKLAYVGMATGTFINRNHLAGYLEMTIAIGIGLLLASWSSKASVKSWRHRIRSVANLLLSQKLFLRLILAMMVIALVLTRSRMGNTAFFTSLLLAGLIYLGVFRVQTGSFRKMFLRRDTRSAALLLVSLMVIDLFIVGAWFGVDKVMERIEQSSTVNDADRVEVTLNTFKLWQDYPIVGAGGGTFHTVYPRYRPDSIGAYFDHTHQDYLEVAADNGLIGLGLLGAMVVTSFAAALSALKRRRDPLMRSMAFASIMGIISLMIHSTVDFNLQIPANAATFIAILALAWISLNLNKHSDSKHDTD